MKHRKQYLLIALVTILLMSSACSTVTNIYRTDPLTSAKTTADMLTRWYQSTYELVSNSYQVADESRKKKMRISINPLMNKVKRTIRTYVVFVQLWESSNNPANTSEQLNEIAVLIAELQSNLASLGINAPELSMSSANE